jgi:peptidylprolyl isomerase
LQQVIRGWQEGLPLCKVGAKIVLIVPPDLGYGASAQNKIPANSTLIFNIEVLGANS